MKAFRLAYADFASKDVEKMAAYYMETMGYVQTERGENGAFYLSNGLDHHNIVLTPADHSGIHRYGYQLDGKMSMKEVQGSLKNLGIESVLKVDAKPGTPEFLEVEDPAGNIVEIFNVMEQPAVGYGKSGIIPLKLGHIAFCAKNHQKTVQFYEEALGFTFTDKIGEDFANFMTCNTDHHVLNIIASNKTKLHHIAYQLKDASHQYASSDLLARQDIPVIWGPSRHTSGHNIATYHFDPDQSVIELFFDMDIYIPELGIFEPRPWHKEMPLRPKVWEGLSSWGTHFEMDLAAI